MLKQTCQKIKFSCCRKLRAMIQLWSLLISHCPHAAAPPGFNVVQPCSLLCLITHSCWLQSACRFTAGDIMNEWIEGDVIPNRDHAARLEAVFALQTVTGKYNCTRKVCLKPAAKSTINVLL